MRLYFPPNSHFLWQPVIERLGKPILAAALLEHCSGKIMLVLNIALKSVPLYIANYGRKKNKCCVAAPSKVNKILNKYSLAPRKLDRVGPQPTSSANLYFLPHMTHDM